METILLRSKEFDDRFRMEILWRKGNRSPLRVRLVFESPELSEESFELPGLDIVTLLGDALKDADSLCLQEVASCLASLGESCAWDSASSAQSSKGRKGAKVSA
jgi:hypothetical protein